MVYIMECAICYKKIEKSHPRLECGHIIHVRCMRRWYRENRISRSHTSCPLCRKTVQIYPNTRQSKRVSNVKSMTLLKMFYLFDFIEDDGNFELWITMIIDYLHFVKQHHADLLMSDKWYMILDSCISFCYMLQLQEGRNYMITLCHMGMLGEEEPSIVDYDFKKDVRKRYTS